MRRAAEFPASQIPVEVVAAIESLAATLGSLPDCGSVALFANLDGAAQGLNFPSARVASLEAPLPEELSAFCDSPQSRISIRFYLGMNVVTTPPNWESLETALSCPANSARMAVIPFGPPGEFPGNAECPLHVFSWSSEIVVHWSAATGFEVLVRGTTREISQVEVKEILRSAPQQPDVAASSGNREASSRSPVLNGYEEKVEKLREEMRAGNCYLANLCERVDWPGVAPFQGMRAFLASWLRDPSPCGLWVSVAEIGIACFTPERFLLRKGPWVLTEPIKGTAPIEPSSPHSGAQWLWSSKKEMAEHRMVVDLLRHDLNMVCIPGSVGVNRAFQVMQRQGLHQMQTRVFGRVPPETSHVDILRATLPAGSISGTPKIAVCEYLTRLENRHRNYYTGTVVVADASGFDSWLLIRSFFRVGESWSVGIGAGITALSNAQAEAQECVLKWDSIAWRAGVSADLA